MRVLNINNNCNQNILYIIPQGLVDLTAHKTYKFIVDKFKYIVKIT